MENIWFWVIIILLSLYIILLAKRMKIYYSLLTTLLNGALDANEDLLRTGVHTIARGEDRVGGGRVSVIRSLSPRKTSDDQPYIRIVLHMQGKVRPTGIEQERRLHVWATIEVTVTPRLGQPVTKFYPLLPDLSDLREKLTEIMKKADKFGKA